MSRAEIIELLDAPAGMVVPVDLNFLWRPQLSAPADELVLETGVNRQASALVTWNTRDFFPAAKKIGWGIMRTDEFWARICKRALNGASDESD